MKQCGRWESVVGLGVTGTRRSGRLAEMVETAETVEMEVQWMCCCQLTVCCGCQTHSCELALWAGLDYELDHIS